jgi:hypothetical protein
MQVLIVRRGLSERYYQLLQIFARTRGLEILVDRRTADRRRQQQPVEQDRRAHERRRPPPRTWAAADFVVMTRPKDP